MSTGMAGRRAVVNDLENIGLAYLLLSLAASAYWFYAAFKAKDDVNPLIFYLGAALALACAGQGIVSWVLFRAGAEAIRSLHDIRRQLATGHGAPRPSEAAAPFEEPEAELLTCPNCAAPVRAEDERCPKCGAEFEPA